MPTSRRNFSFHVAATLLAPRLLLSQAPEQQKPTARPNVGAIDHDRILQAAQSYLSIPPAPITMLPAPNTPGTPHDFYSEADDYWPDPDHPTGPYLVRTGPPNPNAFTAHRDALLNMSLYVPALTAAFVLTREPRYAAHAAAHLRAWFIDPATNLTPSILYAQVIPPAKTGRLEGIVEAIHLAEVAQSIIFLADSSAFTPAELSTLQEWFVTYYTWLNTSRLAGLARDHKSHHGSSWLLQAAAFAYLDTQLSAKPDDRQLSELRHHFESSTIRAQILADGSFPHELSTPTPYRNSLFNLNMLATICNLLSTRFESVWDYELQDGPGMHVAIARHYPFILNRGAWPYRADATHFNDLPTRPPSLLFAARAYNRPEYAELWKTLPPDPAAPELQRTFPIRQPLLWVTRPRP
jgi:hypothetical protein